MKGNRTSRSRVTFMDPFFQTKCALEKEVKMETEAFQFDNN